jgi:hypothetical protein
VTNQIPVVSCGGGICTANWVTQPAATLVATATGVNFNSGNTDNAITLALPSGFTRVRLLSVSLSNASHTLVTATCGVFTATAAGGVALVTSASAITVSAITDATANNMQVFDRTSGLTAAAANTSFVAQSLATPNTIYFRVQTAEGAAATGDVTVTYTPMP